MSFLARTLLLLCTMMLLATTSLYPAATDRVVRISDRQMIDFNTMVEESSDARFIFLAENHDDVRHHAAQLEFIKRLQQEGKPLAIGLEMFTVSSQEMLDHWVSGKLSLEKFKQVYRKDWNMPWEYYRDILLYARDNRIRLYGLNLPREITSKVARQGFAALTPDERLQLPPGISCSVSPVYMALLRQAYSDHGLSEKSFRHFCEAQVLWNRHMAIRMRMFQKNNPSHTMVALVGIGHAVKRGAPEALNIDASAYRVILPEFPGLNRHNLTPLDADYLLLFDN